MLRLTGAMLVLASGVLTRQSLLTASRARRTALRELAEALEVSKGTIQFFFQTKAFLSPVYQDTVQTRISVHRSHDCYAVVALLNV